jgi:4-amino-4-deoxy-L-arabinose transferase-like glycosyltransferase
VRELRRLAFPALLALAGLALLARLGHAPLFDPDEARFARTSVEMARSGDLVVPTFLGEPRLQKPPLLHWLQAALFGAFGPREFLARLPAAVATLGSLAILGIAARRKFGPEAAPWSVAALGTMPLFVLLGRSGTTDALLAVHVLAAVLLDLAPPDEERKGRALLFGALLGMSFLAKGPVGLFLPVLVVLAGRTAALREVWPGWRAVAKALAAALAVAAPWGLALLARVGWPTIRDLLATELGGRIAVGAGHPEPAWYYPAVLPVVTLPWGLVIATALIRAVVEGRDPASRTARYAAAGLVAGIAFFSLSRGKLPSYLLPLLPLAALLVACEVGESLRRAPARTLAPLLVAATLFAEAGAVAVLAVRRIEEGDRALAWTMAAILAAGACTTAVFWILRRPRGAWGAGALTQAAVLVAVAWFPPAALTERRSTAALVAASPEFFSPRPLVLAVDPHPSLAFYTGRIPELVPASEIEARLGSWDGAIWVFERDDWEALDPALRDRFRIVRSRGHFLAAESRFAEPRQK